MPRWANPRLALTRGPDSRTLRGRCAGAEERPGEVSKIIVDVMLKREIHDPQGEAISRACQRLGFGDVVGVRQGKRFEVEVSGPADPEALRRVGELAGELLANPVIEEFALREG
jgi:phosphoribosylformylglycinamidine synthase PurS subunit